MDRLCKNTPFGVELCLECHGGSLMEDSPSTERLLGLVDRRNLTVNLQFPLEGEPWDASARTPPTTMSTTTRAPPGMAR